MDVLQIVSGTSRHVDSIEKRMDRVESDLREILKLVRDIRNELIPKPATSITLVPGPVEEQP